MPIQPEAKDVPHCTAVESHSSDVVEPNELYQAAEAVAEQASPEEIAKHGAKPWLIRADGLVIIYSSKGILRTVADRAGHVLRTGPAYPLAR